MSLFRWMANKCCCIECPPCPEGSDGARGWTGTKIPGCKPCYECPPCPGNPRETGWSPELGGNPECLPCPDCPPCEGFTGKFGYAFGGTPIAGCRRCPRPSGSCGCSPTVTGQCCCSQVPGSTWPSGFSKPAPLYYIAHVEGVQLPPPCPAASPCIACTGYKYRGNPNISALLLPIGACSWSSGNINGSFGIDIWATRPENNPPCTDSCEEIIDTSTFLSITADFAPAVDGTMRGECGYSCSGAGFGVSLFTQSDGLGPLLADVYGEDVTGRCCAPIVFSNNENVVCPVGSHAQGIGGKITLTPVF